MHVNRRSVPDDVHEVGDSIDSTVLLHYFPFFKEILRLVVCICNTLRLVGQLGWLTASVCGARVRVCHYQVLYLLSSSDTRVGQLTLALYHNMWNPFRWSEIKKNVNVVFD